MRLERKLAAAAILSIGITACTTDPYTGQQQINRTAVGIAAGAVGGYLLGDLIGGSSDRTERLIGAGVGAIAGGAVGAYMDRQEAELRRQTAGTGVDVIRQGDEIQIGPVSAVILEVGEAVQPTDKVASTASPAPRAIPASMW